MDGEFAAMLPRNGVHVAPEVCYAGSSKSRRRPFESPSMNIILAAEHWKACAEVNSD